MAIDPRLERYLSDLERALRPLPVSDRADIVTEIKSHALSALERDPQASLDVVLGALGEPEMVANRYLMERGQQPVKPPISPIVKWLVIGFLGTFALILLFIGVLIFKLESVMDRADGGVGKLSILARIADEFDGHEFDGSRDLGTSDKRSVEIRFSNGKFELENSDDHFVKWSCRGKGGHQREKFNPPAASGGESSLLLDFDGYSGIKCTVSVPKGAALNMRGSNGKIDLQEPLYAINLNLANGKVEIDPSRDALYRYALSVGNGKVDEFHSSDDPKAYAVSVRLGNGTISKE